MGVDLINMTLKACRGALPHLALKAGRSFSLAFRLALPALLLALGLAVVPPAPVRAAAATLAPRGGSAAGIGEAGAAAFSAAGSQAPAPPLLPGGVPALGPPPGRGAGALPPAGRVKGQPDGGPAPGAAPELLVKFRRPSLAAKYKYMADNVQGRTLGNLGIAVLPLEPGADMASARDRWQRNPDVAWAEPNYRRHISELAPNDPFFSQQWYLARMRIPAAWQLTQGDNNVIVAVVDTGVDAGHPDLAGRLVPGWNIIANNADTSDPEGHGTLVAGEVAAVTDNNQGVAGVTWQGRIMPVLVMDASGYGYDSDIAAGIVWAADHGARVINLSLGAPQYSQTLHDAVAYATGKGAVVVAAAGNEYSWGVDYPAAYPEVLAVGASDENDRVAPFSNYGPELDVVAPGTNIIGLAPGNRYVQAQGTSMATPLASGLAALLLSQRPGATIAEVQQSIAFSADDIEGKGWDLQSGYGRLDAWQALQSGGVDGRVLLPGRYRAGMVGVQWAGASDRMVGIGPEGGFILAGLPPGTGQVMFTAPGFLRARRQVTITTASKTALGDIQLLPGDINGDNQVDLQDLTLLATTYRTTSADGGYQPAADFDGDGRIDLVDLTLLAGSYRRSGD
ncbi:MAG: thermitase [Moorella sp. (in: firmicutes)]|nr:thermitase [Moorella sp. (in: firmicutes)]